ncbi:MAG TPA: hypothetical protein VFA33_13280 [Bryobacteraceae bacterium]|nr:hypothetical protein [Bryobacteraceae bacterium]
MTARTLKSELTYLRSLIEAGWNGALSARRELGSSALTPVKSCSLLAPAAVGASLGALSAFLGTKRRSGYRSAMGGLIGSVVGLGAGVAWSSRGVAGHAARGAIRKINTVREARWLEENPIDYA